MDLILQQWGNCDSYEDSLEVANSGLQQHLISVLQAPKPPLLQEFRSTHVAPYVDIQYHVLRLLGELLTEYLHSTGKNGAGRSALKRQRTENGAAAAATTTAPLDFGSEVVQVRCLELLREFPVFSNSSSSSAYRVACPLVTRWAKSAEQQVKGVRKKRSRKSGRCKGVLAVLSPEVHSELLTQCYVFLFTLPCEMRAEVKLLALKDTADHIAAHRVSSSSTSSVSSNSNSSLYALWDVLSAAFDMGGAFAVHALHGLFTLMVHYNMDYPSYYDKLYSLLTPEVFHSRYRKSFLDVLALSLTSTRLPAYLVASFIKRSCRICLTVPTPLAPFVLSLIYNLLRSHQETMALIHRTEAADISNTENNEDLEKIKQLYLGQDPFMEHESDPRKTNALFSSCWELKAVMDHWCPRVSVLAAAFQGEMRAPRRDLSEQTGQSYFKMFVQEVTHHAATLRQAAEVETTGGRGRAGGGGGGDVTISSSSSYPPVTFRTHLTLFDSLEDSTVAWTTCWDMGGGLGW